MRTRGVMEGTIDVGAVRQLELPLHSRSQASAEIVHFPVRKDERRTEALTRLLQFAETLGAKELLP